MAARDSRMTSFACRRNSPLKEMLDDMHFSKIDMADEIFVVNPGGYVGESTAREIGYALSCGKPVCSLCPLPLEKYAANVHTSVMPGAGYVKGTCRCDQGANESANLNR